MRTARQPQPPATIATLPPPIGGLNARDPISSMPAEDAIQLDNWFPDSDFIAVRNGWASFCAKTANFDTVARRLFIYNSPTVSKMFVSTDTKIIEISAAGADTVRVTGGHSGSWETVIFGNGINVYLLGVNGNQTDGMVTFEGTTWGTAVLTGGPGPGPGFIH